MKSNIQTFFNDEENCVGRINITYINRNESYKNGVLCGLMGLCVGCYDNGLPVEIEEIANDDLVWYFDTPLKEILNEPNHKKYVVFLTNLEEYGVYIGTDNIIQFISGFASCPRAFLNCNNQDWRTLKYLDTTLIPKAEIIDEQQYFDKSVLDLEELLTINTIQINCYPL